MNFFPKFKNNQRVKFYSKCIFKSSNYYQKSKELTVINVKKKFKKPIYKN